MEKKIKILYISTIIAILAFLGMQVYWLYGRYEFSLIEYEQQTESVIADILVAYNKERGKKGDYSRITSSFNMSHGVDSAGRAMRKVTVSTSLINGRKLLGITEDRKLTEEEKKRLYQLVTDSLQRVEEKKLSIDASTASTDGMAWSAMKNFELEVQSPFTIQGIDTLLSKENIKVDVSLITTDSLMWKSVLIGHESLINPTFRIISPYSELERKAVVIESEIPVAGVIRELGLTLILSFIISLFLIFCLIWQIATIVKLSRLDNMRNSFITTMIHELKRPLSTLKMCVSGLDNESMLEDKEIRKELLTETRNALDNLSAYFSKLRDITFNKVEQIPLNIQSVNLHDLLETVAEAAVRPPEKRVVIKNEIDPQVIVSADRSHLYNILNNLVENAVKYSGSEIEVKAAAIAKEGIVSLTVSDNGYGISPEDIKHVFTRFYRGKHSGSEQPGMGLGLSYVKLLVEAHHGDISVESREGKGTCFTIKLPQ